MWPRELRERIEQRLVRPDCPPLVALADETGIPAGTLGHWRKQLRGAERHPFMREDVGMSSNNDRRDTDWNPNDRFRAVFETENLEGEELGAYLREHGLHAATLERWRQDALAGLGTPRKQPKSSRRIRELERELRRKEKALAETAALLVLQKKLRHLLEDEDDSQEPR